MASTKHAGSAIIFLNSFRGEKGNGFGTLDFFLTWILMQAVARVTLGVEGKAPPKVAGKTSGFGSKISRQPALRCKVRAFSPPVQIKD